IRIDEAVRAQAVVGSQRVVQVDLARDRLALALGGGMAGEIEGQAHAAQCGDLPRARQVLLLAAAPAMHEEHARDAFAGHRGLSTAGAGTRLDADRVVTARHAGPPWRTW